MISIASEVITVPGILIRDIPEQLYNKLKGRAKANGRSLQQELKAILSDAIKYDMKDGIQLAAKIRKELEARKVRYSDSTVLIEEDRKR